MYDWRPGSRRPARASGWGLTILSILLMLVLTGPGAGPALADSKREADTGLPLEDCTLGPSGLQARCGSYTVFENRAKREGPTIDLNIAVVPASGPDPAADPVFFLSGGPGEPAVGLVEMIGLGPFESLNREREIVLVDQRGTGKSNPLKCDLYEDEQALRQLLAVELFPEDSVTRCLEQTSADVTQYTTPIAMDDLDEVREALGYEKINVIGGSYGARAALVYLRRHPDHVRSVAISQPSPTHRAAALQSLRAGDDALRTLIADCAGEEACRSAFPRLREEIETVAERLGTEPARVTAAHPVTGEEVTVEITRDAFLFGLRIMLYAPPTAAQVPLTVHGAMENDFQPIVMMLFRLGFMVEQILSPGMFLTVWCSEYDPMFTDRDLTRQAEGLLGTDQLLERSREACSIWPKAELPEGYFEPVRSDVPVLIVTGEADPATPPGVGKELARHLSNRALVIVPGSGHQIEGGECLQGIVDAFVSGGSADGLETACLAAIGRSPFVVDPPGQ